MHFLGPTDLEAQQGRILSDVDSDLSRSSAFEIWSTPAFFVFGRCFSSRSLDRRASWHIQAPNAMIMAIVATRIYALAASSNLPSDSSEANVKTAQVVAARIMSR